MQVVSEAPTRVDLAGGTIDLWPIHQMLAEKATVNIAVTLTAKVILQTLPSDSDFVLHSLDQNVKVAGNWSSIASSQHELSLLGLCVKYIWNATLGPISIQTSAKSPAGAGLGGSSCLAIATLSSLFAAKHRLDGSEIPSREKLVAIAQDIEAQIIKIPTGVQDYWAAVCGGVNCLSFPPGGVKIKTLEVTNGHSLDEQMIVCYSGQSRASAINNWEIFKRVFDGDRELIQNFEKIGALATQCARHLESGDLSSALAISAKEWDLRTKIWPGIETSQTKKLSAAALSAGAQLARVCGAGGGGVMVIFAPSKVRAQVIQELKKAGGQVLDASIAHEGVKVVVSKT